MPTFSEPDPEVLQDRADRPVLRVGDRVRHPSQPWSSSVQALLAHLREVGFTEAPQPFGVTPDGDEVAFIPGVGGDDACLLVDSDSAVAAVGDLLRRYHEAVAGWRPVRRSAGSTAPPGEVPARALTPAHAWATPSSATVTSAPGTWSGGTVGSWD